jgi:putative ABC transport system permease protein
MRWTTKLAMRLRMLFQRKKASERLDDELSFHLEQQIAENLSAGMSEEEARFAALRGFGNPALLREEARATWNWSWAEAILSDLRVVLRSLARRPGFSALVILVMATGIGANVALFTIVRDVLQKPLPFRDPDHLMMVFEQSGNETLPVSGGVFAEWKRQNHTFSDLALMDQELYNVSGDGNQLPERLDGANCSWNFFPMLGVTPALGRSFTAADDSRSANSVVMLTWSFWQRRFGGNRAILNQTIRMNRRPYTVVGILPQWFTYPYADLQLWTPAYHDKPLVWMNSLSSHELLVVGQLKHGATMSEAAADLSVISQRIHDQHADNPSISKGASILPLLENLVGDLRQPLYVLLGASGCFLLVACMNVASLLVAWSAAHQKDLALRWALGAGRLRLLHARLMESLVLCAASAAIGLGLAYAALRWLMYARADMPRVSTIHIDGTVAAFSVGIAVTCAVFTTLMSFLSTHRVQPYEALQSSGREHSSGRSHARLRKTLLALEVGGTTVLLVAAGLLLKSYWNLERNDMGCATKNVLTMRLGFFGGRFSHPAELANFYATLLTRVRAVPGVESAGFTEAAPGQGYWEDRPFAIVEHPPLPPEQAQSAIDRFVDPGYFAAMGIPLLRGRSFDPAKRLEDADEAVISKSFAGEYFPGEDPIGKHLRFQGRAMTIVGVVGDTRYAVAEAPMPMQYYSIYAGTANNGTLVIRSSHNVEQLALPVQRMLASLDRDLPVSNVLTMDQLLGKTISDSSFNAAVLLGFSILSLLMAAVGLFGVLSYIVAQRTGEIGIRIALGAQREQVLGTVLLDGLRPALFGLALGLAGSVAVVRLIRSMLYQTQPLDPAVFVGVAVTLLLVAAAACLIPAWRASRLDPMQALRME